LRFCAERLTPINKVKQQTKKTATLILRRFRSFVFSDPRVFID